MKHRLPLYVCLAAAVVFLNGACASQSKKRDPDFLGNYPVQALGVLRLNLVKRYANTLLPRDVSFVYESSTNSVKFHHKMMGDNIWITLKKKERALMRSAIEQYLKAFKEKTLTPEGAKQKGAFGKVGVPMSWGILGSAHQAVPTLRFDYQFITPQRPYFILASRTSSAKDGANSPAIRIAISPAQCRDVLTLLDEKALMDLVESLKAEYEKFDGTPQKGSPVRAIENSPEADSDEVTQEDTPFDEF